MTMFYPRQLCELLLFVVYLGGFLCAAESPVVPSCDLECANGGYCATLRTTNEILAMQVQSGKMVTRCICPPGFTGMACDMVEEECAAPDFRCNSNGAPCRMSGSEYVCDCAAADAVSIFAGAMCRKPYTEYCTPRFEPHRTLSFCTNGGKCLGGFFAAQLAPGNTTAMAAFEHAGCRCPPEFYGPHCELLRTSADIGLAENIDNKQNPDSSRPLRIMWIVLLVMSILGLVMILVLVTFRGRSAISRGLRRRFRRRSRGTFDDGVMAPTKSNNTIDNNSHSSSTSSGRRHIRPNTANAAMSTTPVAAFPPDLNFGADDIIHFRTEDDDARSTAGML